MKFFSNKITATLAFSVVVIGLALFAFGHYMVYRERRDIEMQTIESCKNMYRKKLHDFDVTFEKIALRYIEKFDLGGVMEITGEAIYTDKDGTIKNESMGCKMSVM